MSIAPELPIWSALVFAIVFAIGVNAARRWVRIWALLTLPATAMHELAHGLVGWLLAAQPSSLSLWPKRVSVIRWRLGYVGFSRLVWWNAGAVALAPLLWFLVLLGLMRHAPDRLPNEITLLNAALGGICLVWLWKAIAPSRSDWALAFRNPLSALAFLLLWLSVAYWLILRYLPEGIHFAIKRQIGF